MKNSLVLVVVGIAYAGIAWGFWYFLEADALSVFTIIALVVTAGDNLRLRKQLRDQSSRETGGEPG